jgi:hypothetical protein
MRRAAVTLALIFAARNASAQNANATGYKIAHKPRMALVLTGAGLVGLGFSLSVLTAALEGFGGISPLIVIPLAGPWIGFGWDMANPKACPLDVNTVDCSSFVVDPGLVAYGVVEFVGAVLLGVGLVPHDQKTKVNVSPTFAWHDGPRFGLALHF